MAEIKEKVCAWCRKPLEQRIGESDYNFRKRITCDRACASRRRQAIKSKR